MSKVHYTHCPVCASDKIDPLLTVKDHSVSQEVFVIWQCSSCSLRFTQDAPDQNSIGPYYQSQNYISHSNTGKGFINKVYQKVRTHTLEQKADLIIAHTKPKGKILDVGAGIGAFLNVMRQKSWEVTGIEPDAGARQNARNLFNLELESSDALDAFPAGKFDAITLWHVLEHVHALHDYIEKLKSILSEKGKIFIAVPNYQSLDSSVYNIHWAAYDVPRHLFHFSPKSIQILIEKHGLKMVEKKPMWFDSVYISFLSSKYRFGKTHWLGALMVGIRSNWVAFFNKNKCSSLIYIISKA